MNRGGFKVHRCKLDIPLYKWWVMFKWNFSKYVNFMNTILYLEVYLPRKVKYMYEIYYFYLFSLFLKIQNRK